MTSVRKKFEQNVGNLDSKLDHPAWGSPMARFGEPLPPIENPEQFAKNLVKYITSQAEADISPFYKHLLAGKIPLEGVQEWIKQLYYDARGFPVMIAQIIANSGNQYDIRQTFGCNLAEELGEFNPHFEHPILLMRVGKALGLKAEDMEFATPIPEVLIYTEYRHKQVKDGNFLEAICAGSLSNEAIIVKRYKLIIKALKHYYNVPDEALEYFYIHSGGRSEIDYGGDWAHAGEAMQFVSKYATTAEMQERCRQAVWRAVESRKVYLWGLFRHIILKNHPSYNDLINVPEYDKKAG